MNSCVPEWWAVPAPHVAPVVKQLLKSNSVRGRDHIVVRFTTIYAYHVVYSIQHYVIKFVSNLRQVGGFLQVLRFLAPIKLTAMIWLRYCWRCGYPSFSALRYFYKQEIDGNDISDSIVNSFWKEWFNRMYRVLAWFWI